MNQAVSAFALLSKILQLGLDLRTSGHLRPLQAFTAARRKKASIIRHKAKIEKKFLFRDEDQI